MKTTLFFSALLTAATTTLPLSLPADVTDVIFGRTSRSFQSDASTVALSGEKPYSFEVQVQEDSATSLFSACALDTPAVSLAFSKEDTAWEYESTYSTLEDLQAAIPAGTYTLSMTKKAGGTTNVVNTLAAGNLKMTSAPFIQNYTDLQGVDPTVDFPIVWYMWTAGSSSDYITVRIETLQGKEVYASPEPPSASALHGTSSKATIPAGTLATGTTYVVKVSFLRILSYGAPGTLEDYPNAFTANYSQATTTFHIKTSGVPPLNTLLTYSLWSDNYWTIHVTDETVNLWSPLPTGNRIETISFQSPDGQSLDLSMVKLTGPAGSVYSATPANGSYSNDGACTYNWLNFSPYIANGAYTVNYNGTDYSDASISYAPQASDDITLRIWIGLTGQMVRCFSYNSYSPADPSKSFSLNDGDGTISWQVRKNNKIVYEAYGIPPSTNLIDVSSANLNIKDIDSVCVSLHGTPNAAGTRNVFSTNYFIHASNSIFYDLPHANGWVIPQGDIRGTIGWIYDEMYPWVYMASLDAYSNGGTYKGDGSGWIYIMDGASLTDGFFFYYCHAHSWAWTNYDWTGVFYTYDDELNVNGIGDMTP